MSGWMELVELTRLYLQQPDALEEVIPHWQQRYPGHPASTAFIAETAGHHARGRPTTRQHRPAVAPQWQTGQCRRAPSVTASSPPTTTAPAASNQPQLQIYDSGEHPRDAVAAYQQAVADGAEFVIGPLRKEAVEALANNRSCRAGAGTEPDRRPDPVQTTSLYQFGLAPEDEAREVARLAWRDGHHPQHRPAAGIPTGVNASMRPLPRNGSQLGGVILEAQRYDASKTDHGKIISSVLNLDSSKARQQQLSRTWDENWSLNRAAARMLTLFSCWPPRVRHA